MRAMPRGERAKSMLETGTVAARQSAVYTLRFNVGTWRSLVAHLHGVQGVASSNLAVPTNHQLRRFQQPLATRFLSTARGTKPSAPVSLNS